MNLFLFFSLINGITATALGTFVFFKNRKSLINKTFFLMSLGVAIWSFSYCKWLLVEEREIALFWSRVLNFGATLIPIFYLHWVLNLLNLDKEKRKVLIFGYLITFIFLSFSFTPYYIELVKPVLSFPYWPQAGPLYICFLFLGYFGLVGYALFQLFQARKIAQKEKRNQIDYVILGTILGFGGGATNFPLMFGISLLPPVGQPFTALYVIILTFAITKYHLFEIRVILTELLVGAIGLISLIQTFNAPSFSWRILNGVIFILFCIFGYYLIKATHEEIKRREEAERLVEEFARLDKVKNQFILSAQHHLRTPLSIMKGYVSLILEGTYGKLNQKMKEKLIFIQKANTILINLVNDFLDITQFQLGKDILNKKEVQIEDLISQVIEELKPEAERKSLYLRFEKPEKILPKIKVDPEKLKEVIFNIVDNGIKYTQKGGVTIELQIANSQLQIAIKDTGIGMEKGEFLKLFDGFFERGEKAKEVYATGRGIGLYIASQIIKAHNGKIWAESEGKERGSTFYIELPISV